MFVRRIGHHQVDSPQKLTLLASPIVVLVFPCEPEQALIIFVEIYFARILILIWHDVTRLDFTYFSSILWDFIGLRYWIILITFMFFWLQYGNFQ